MITPPPPRASRQAKKALINGLGTDAPATTAGAYTSTSTHQRVGGQLGEATVLYRDRCAVLMWQGVEEEKAKVGAKRLRG